jgi:hypothetical protein
MQFSPIGWPGATTFDQDRPSQSTATRELASSWLLKAMPERTRSAVSDGFKPVTKQE